MRQEDRPARLRHRRRASAGGGRVQRRRARAGPVAEPLSQTGGGDRRVLPPPWLGGRWRPGSPWWPAPAVRPARPPRRPPAGWRRPRWCGRRLTNTVQVGGSIGYTGAYTIAAPSGSSAPGDPAGPADRDRGSAGPVGGRADRVRRVDGRRADDRGRPGRRHERVGHPQRRPGRQGAATAPARRRPPRRAPRPRRRSAQDQTPLTQAEQQLAGAQATATLDHDQNAGKVGADQTKLARRPGHPRVAAGHRGQPGHDLHLAAADGRDHQAGPARLLGQQRAGAAAVRARSPPTAPSTSACRTAPTSAS